MSPYVASGGGEHDAVDYGVFGGIVIGLSSALLWQRYHRIRLPTYLAFFGGRRFVPILSAVAALLLGVLLAFAYPAFDAGLTAFGRWLVGNDVLGAGAVRRRQPADGPLRTAPPGQLGAVVRRRLLRGRRRSDRAR